jgi:hypothetical protein
MIAAFNIGHHSGRNLLAQGVKRAQTSVPAHTPETGH